MKRIALGKTGIEVPILAVGCMRMNALNKAETEKFIHSCLDWGANFFDHADIYGRGECETLFGAAISPALREKMLLQSKCGIVPGQRFDFSKEHILQSVDDILRRLKTEYIDVLLLHRPDALMEPEEVAEAFDALRSAGKVRHFGVSNQNPGQMKLLMRCLEQPLVANQLQFGIAHAGMVAEGLHVNMNEDSAIQRSGGVLDFCRLHEITIQAWSPFQHGMFQGVFLGDARFPALNQTIQEIAERYGASDTAIALAWIFRHPARIQAVAGTMNLQRMEECVKATEIHLTRQEWYDIYLAAGNTLP